jgi:hypothetical protein
MKKSLLLLFVLFVLVLAQSCKKDKESSTDANTLGGDPSPMAAVGETVSSSTVPISGISNLNATVISVADGVSSYSGSGIVTDPTIKNILSSMPGIVVSGDAVTATDFKFRQTTDGIESLVGMGPGIIVKYASNVGDTYSVGSTGRTRTVASKSTTDDYYYGGMLIKTMKIEEPTPGLKSTLGVTKITYWANHKFGLVGIQYNFADGSSFALPVYSSTTN